MAVQGHQTRTRSSEGSSQVQQNLLQRRLVEEQKRAKDASRHKNWMLSEVDLWLQVQRNRENLSLTRTSRAQQRSHAQMEKRIFLMSLSCLTPSRKVENNSIAERKTLEMWPWSSTLPSVEIFNFESKEVRTRCFYSGDACRWLQELDRRCGRIWIRIRDIIRLV